MIEPAEPSAYAGWEDPAQMLRSVERSDPTGESVVETDPRDEPSGSANRVERIIDNVDEALRSSALVTGSAIAAVVTVAWFFISWVVTAVRRHRSPDGGPTPDPDRRRSAAFDLSLVTAVYVGGLLVLAVQARYLYFAMLVAVAVAGLGLSRLACRSPRWRRGAFALAIVVALSTAVRPAVAIVRLDDRASDFQSIERLFADVDVENRRVASFPPLLSDIGSRCFADDCVYLGAPRLDGGATLAAQLDAFDVDVFVVDAGRAIEVPPGSEIIARSPDASLVVYDVSDVSR